MLIVFILSDISCQDHLILRRNQLGVIPLNKALSRFHNPAFRIRYVRLGFAVHRLVRGEGLPAPQGLPRFFLLLLPRRNLLLLFLARLLCFLSRRALASRNRAKRLS